LAKCDVKKQLNGPRQVNTRGSFFDTLDDRKISALEERRVVE